MKPEDIVSNKSNPYGIPRELRKYIRKHPRYGEKVYQEFRTWYSKNIRGSGTKGAKIFEDFSEALQGAGITDAATPGKRSYSVNQSHIQSHKLKGSGHTFLEYWVENQKRASSEKAGIPFINAELMEEAGLPKNWVELFHFWDLEQQGQLSSLGSLATINPDDLIALHRGDSVNKVFERREALDQILELAVNDPSTITQNQSTYAELFAKSRGLNPNDTRDISLRQHAGWTLDAEGNYVQLSEEDAAADFFARTTERMGGKDINYEGLEDLNQMTDQEILGPEDFDDKPLGHDYTLDKAILALTPGGRQIVGALSGINKGVQLGKGVWNSNTVKNIRKSDFIQNLGKKDASKMQKTVKPKSNELGIKLDQQLGNLIKQQDKLINQSYQERIDPGRLEQIVDEAFDPNLKWDDRPH